MGLYNPTYEATPSAPAAGSYIYPKADGLWYFRSAAGAEIQLANLSTAQTFALLQTFTSGLKSTIGISVGGATAGTGGLAFPATAVAVADANTLDDYEEGAWTPTDGGGAGLTFANLQSCTYTKIGDFIAVIAQFDYPTTADVTAASISGLPFAIGSGTRGGSSIGYQNSAVLYSLYINGNVNALQFLTIPYTAAVTNAQLSGKSVSFNAFYSI